MGKDSAGSPGSRSEPYNHPSKIYNVADGKGAIASWRLMNSAVRAARQGGSGARSGTRGVGNNIAFQRARAGFGVPQFARRMRITVARLERIEAGKERLTLSLVERIAAALGCFLSVELV